MEFAFNPCFLDLTKNFKFIDQQLADKAENLLLKEFEDAANFLNEKENAIDGPSPVPRHARRRSSNFGVQPTNQQPLVLGELAGLCDGFENGVGDEADKEGLYNGADALEFLAEAERLLARLRQTQPALHPAHLPSAPIRRKRGKQRSASAKERS